jgi:protein-S-isoprenylcysteine O-methyltransferase Ste14
LSAWGIFLSNWLAFLFLPVFVVYINRFQIVTEEQSLISLFAREFVAYQSRVRRWL